MKIIVLTNQAPFVRGGAEYHAESLVGRLAARGHQAEVMRLPFKWYPPQAIPEHLLACRLLRVDTGEPDLVIAMKFPVYCCPFPNKKLWLVHQFRQAYDLWGTPYGSLPDTPEGRAVRDLVVRADNEYLPQAKAIYTNARNTADRLRRYNGITADGVLYPPLDRPHLYQPGEAEDYFFYPSRMGPGKRQHLAIEALARTRAPVKLVLAGKPDGEEYGRKLPALVEELGLGDRVRFLGWVSEEEKARWLARSVGVVFPPYNEDFGYVTLEAFHAHKAVVTCTDSGGPCELVEDGRNGLVTEPTAEALAAALERLWADRPTARALGAEAYLTLGRHHIDWEHVLDRLTA